MFNFAKHSYCYSSEPAGGYFNLNEETKLEYCSQVGIEKEKLEKDIIDGSFILDIKSRLDTRFNLPQGTDTDVYQEVTYEGVCEIKDLFSPSKFYLALTNQIPSLQDYKVKNKDEPYTLNFVIKGDKVYLKLSLFLTV